MGEPRLYLELLDISKLDINLEGTNCVLYNNILYVPENYNRNKLLRLLNLYIELTKLKSFKLLLQPMEFITSEIRILNVYDGINNIMQEFKSLNINKKHIVNGLIEGYYAYYAKKQKKQKGERSDVLYVHTAPIITQGFEEVKKLNMFKPGAFRSTYIYGPQLTACRNKLISLYKNMVIPEYEEIIIPKFTNEKIFARSNHIRLPQHAYIIAKFSPQYIAEVELNGFLFKQWLAKPSYLRFAGTSTYGVCEPFWSYLENTKTAPFRYFDNSGPALRNEGNAIKGFERLDVFSRIELIFAESQEVLLIQHINEYIEKVKNFFNKLDLYYRILEVDSWTAAHKVGKTVKTYDFQVYLAYKDQWLEVCNISNNGIIFSSEFNVRGLNNTFIYTGCGGIGIERLLYSVIEQKGYLYLQNL